MRRLSSDQSEYDYVVLNDSFDHALADLSAIMRAARLRVRH
jgi:guanylate kinase